MVLRRGLTLLLLAAAVLSTPYGASARPARVLRVLYVPDGWPNRLQIPAIGVNAFMENLNMDDPKNVHAPYKWEDVAWNFMGPRPGEPGHAFVFGHLDSYCCPAVFYRLRALTPGTIVKVGYPGNHWLRFKVIWQHQWLNSQVPNKWLFQTRGGQRGLILATCAGDFFRDGTGYNSKLVVFARLVLPNGTLG